MNRFRTVFDHTLISLCNSTTARLLPKLWGVSPAMLQSSQSALESRSQASACDPSAASDFTSTPSSTNSFTTS